MWDEAWAAAGCVEVVKGDLDQAQFGLDEGTWARARGIALHQAAMAIPYYRETNPAFAAVCRRTAAQVLLDLAG